MKQWLLGFSGIVLALGSIVLALGLFYTAYHRVEVPAQLAASSTLTVQGVVLEKLIEQRTDRLLPFKVTTYVVRYAYPNMQGQMRTGEQVVTKGFFEQIGGQGSAVWITFSAEDSSRSAVDPRLTFPGSAGWRVGLGLAAIGTAYAMGRFGLSAIQAVWPARTAQGPISPAD